MGLKRLKVLGQKEYRLFLILVIWLIAAFTIFQLRFILLLPEIVGYIIFLPLIGITMVLTLVSIFTKKDVKELTAKEILKYCLIAIPIMFIFNFIVLIMFFLAIIVYIFITAAFTMSNCYEKGIEFDEKIYNLPWPINFIVRWGQHIFITIFALGLIFIVAVIGTAWALLSSNVADAFAIIGLLIMILIFVLWVLGTLTVLIGKLNAWLSIFFVWVALYSFYLMFKAFLSLSQTGGGVGSENITIVLLLYFFDLWLILSTLGSLVGKKAQIIADKLPIRPETMIILLIFSKAAYEFADVLQMDVGTFKAIGVFVLFAPLFFIAGLWGILKYGKVKKERKKKKKRKKIVKTTERKKKKLIKEAKTEGASKEELSAIRTSTMVFCKKCGAENNPESKFCKGCGADLYYVESKKKY